MSDTDEQSSCESEDNSSIASNESRSSSSSSRSSSSTNSRSRSRSRSKSSKRSGQEEQISNDEEYDSEEEEEKTNNKRKRKKKDRFCDFIIDEAEVDDEVEDDDDWEDEEEIGIVNNEIEELGPTAREIEGRMRESNVWKTQNEEELEEYLRNKYGNHDMAAKHFGEGGTELSDEISQQTLLPHVKDPNLWMIKCRMGEEKKTALLLMRKYFAHQDGEEKLQIKSVIVTDNVKGHVYIEAYKKSHVVAAIENVGSLQMGMKNQQMVPIKEMTDVLRVMKKYSKVKSKQWVRIMRGQYKDDIAQVDYCDAAKNRACLKLLPRIDYSKLRGVLKDPVSETNKRKKQSRPSSKPFDLQAIKSLGGDVKRDGDFYIFEGNRYSSNGFLYKYFTTSGIVYDGVKPTFKELELFEEEPEEMDFQVSTEMNDENHQNYFSNGDNVVICQGELNNLQGKIVSIDGNMITIMPKHDELKDHLVFQASDVKKYFKIGDHVKVLCGRYKGNTAVIVRVEDNRVILIADLTMEEIEVSSKDLQLCTETAKGLDSVGKFELGDLVNLTSNTVGIIVLMEREHFRVLDMHENIVTSRPSSLQKRTLNRFTAALDSSRNNIQRKDVVQVIDGPHSGFTGEIKHLYRNVAFLHSQKFLKNGGNFVCKTKYLQLSDGNKLVPNCTSEVASCPGSPKLAGSSGSDGRKTRGRNNFGRGFGGRGRGGRGRGRGGRFNGDRGLVGKTIKIIRGSYKGHIGIVKDATETTARVELHANYQTISVSKEHIVDVNSNVALNGNKNTIRDSKPNETPSHYEDGSKTPMPNSGSQTPIVHFGSMTPFNDGSKTPNSYSEWDPSVYPSTSYTPRSDYY